MSGKSDASFENPKKQQLKGFSAKEEKFLTSNQGTKISDNQNSLKAGERGPTLLEDHFLREKITHFDHERIPERVVHARGSAAHGYFQVYEPMAKYTKAKFLQDPAGKTPVFVRFSTVAGFRGSADTVRDARGFATKFYTEEGNYDLVGNNIPVFFIQDAIKFPDLIHAVKPEPHNEIPQASSAHDNFWDFISLMPESMHMIMWVISDRALPRSYSMMEGFGVHTFRFVNEEGTSRFVKFHWKPKAGIHSLLFEESQMIGGKAPDFNRKDLWESIEQGNYPEYELGVQMLEESELGLVEFDILDPTKIWPEEDVPVHIIGKMVLNRNPDNFFAETEQVAFHPGHVVPGIDFTNDPLLQGRLFSYIDTQLSRLGGSNFNEIPINKPLAGVSNNQRDGHMRQTINIGRVNYEPNSLAGGCPMQAAWNQGGYASFPEIMGGEKVRVRSESFNDHYTQAILFWNSMSTTERRHMIEAFQFELGNVSHKHIRELMVEHLNHIDHELACRVANGIAVAAPKTSKSRIYRKRSPALSQMGQEAKSIRGRKVAILALSGVNKAQVLSVQESLKKEGAMGEIISKHLGDLPTNNGETLLVDKTFPMASSVLYDAVILPGGSEHIDSLAKNENAILFLNESYRHCKTIGLWGDDKILEKTVIGSVDKSGDNQKNLEAGLVIFKEETPVEVFFEHFKQALGKHRHWIREERNQQ